MLRALQLAYWGAFHLPARVFFRARVEIHCGEIRPPVLLAANHQGRLDPLLLVVLPWRVVRRLAPLRFPTGAYFDHQPLLWRALRLFGAFRLPRIAWSVEEFMAETEACLARGESVLLFPEGRVSATRRPGKPGIGWLARRFRGEIIPVRIDRGERLDVRLGVPISSDDPLRSLPADEAIAEAILDRVYGQGPGSGSSVEGHVSE